MVKPLSRSTRPRIVGRGRIHEFSWLVPELARSRIVFHNRFLEAKRRGSSNSGLLAIRKEGMEYRRKLLEENSVPEDIARKISELSRQQQLSWWHATPEYRKIKADYRLTEKGMQVERAAHERQKGSPKRSASNKRYQRSQKGKAVRKRYQASERGTAAIKLYRDSPLGKATYALQVVRKKISRRKRLLRERGIPMEHDKALRKLNAELFRAEAERERLNHKTSAKFVPSWKKR
ncbi:MAG: hypothetical protein J4224_03380 [Candidatus Diapherotrites archaeon]|uniref:Uncharacterized protein n=1 Tax=Candidatus Iainarchaeum sp. TaxID=3101447 RepID=A0A7J4J157_9ARCH|nr:MAG: hypothetical protein QT03_C0001G0763 [archaeon GW2011_AR10]MBS3059439.1 hypothetical protein [Candidatus Diapherotrites archaeon]HIH08946.1 hypothetical protein [Candidatus Diapherotrites archaeon]